jgi:hypothetical protein
MKKWLLPLAVIGLFSAAVQAQDTSAPGGGGGARAACKADFQKLCKGVKFGGARACLNDHKDEISQGCRDALAKHDAEEAAKGGTPPSSETRK